ncbi:hypothetical protein QQX98_001324 [Neonectria punicea]|uniref:Amidase domain-containing protein n=1 Tax=Neonectria punicea TaxID=979145 RepID=A0ABR1HQG0_9HYPO
MSDFEKALDQLRAAGAVIVDNVRFRSESEWDCSELVENPHDIKSVHDIIEFTHSEPKELYPERNVDRLVSSRDSPGVDAPVTQQALAKMLRISAQDGILGALSDYELDALVFPNDYGRPSTFAARAGMPVLALPLGFYPDGTRTRKTKVGDQIDIAPNVPYGIAFAAQPYSEFRLFQITHAFEQMWALNSSSRLHTVPQTELKDVIGKRGWFASL